MAPRSWAVALACIACASCSTDSPPATGDAAVWTSNDGVAWSRVEDPDLGGQGAQQMTGVIRYDDSLVAVGSSSLGGDGNSRIWVSPNGRDWRVVDDPDLGGPGNQWINAISAAGDLLLAVGGSDEDGDLDVIIWTTEDGVDWERVESPDLGGAGDQMVWPHGNPLVVRDGQIVLVGTSDEEAAIWISTDARSWTRLDDIPDAERSDGLSGVVAGGPGLIAVGAAMTDAGVWASANTAEWKRTAATALDEYDLQRMIGVLATPEGFVAYGDTQSYEEIYFLGWGATATSDAAMWTSSDGLEWSRVVNAPDLAGLGDQHVFAAAMFDDNIYAVGMDSPDPRTGGLVDAGPASGRDVDAAVWVSSDGQNWSRVRSETFGGENWQDMFDLETLNGALFVVGGDDAESER